MTEGEGPDFKEMLNQMKVNEFREQKELELMRKTFQVLNNKVSKNYHPHYTMTLYCKVVKALMISSLQLRTFEEHLEDIYMKMLLKNHFEAMKEFKAVTEAEMQEKIEQIRSVVKRRSIRVLVGLAKERKIDREKKNKVRQEESRV